MKNLILTFIFLSFALGSLISQSVGSVNEIHLIAEKNGNVVRLRWAPSNFDIWNKGNIYGYKIMRQQIEQNEIVTKTLAEKYMPMPENQWDSEFSNNSSAQTAKSLIYSTNINTAPGSIFSLSDAMSKKEQDEGKHLFALVAAENDFKVAVAMALGFEDKDIEVNKFYTYTVVIDDEKEMVGIKQGYSDVKIIQYAAISTLEAKTQDNTVVLEWILDETQYNYDSWFIERSTDSINFVRINNLPFAHSYTDEEFKYRVGFQDAIENCQDQFYYRVQGVTTFGVSGEYSNCVKVLCPIPKIQIPVWINGSTVADGKVFLNWYTFDNKYKDSIIGFNLYRTRDVSLPKTKINEHLLDVTQRKFEDTDSMGTAYYFLEAIDIHGFSHLSTEYFVQMIDSIPPDPPQNILGKFVDSRNLSITWDKNNEKDMYGYDVLLSNTRNGLYVKQNKNILKPTHFSVKFHDQIVTDSIFVVVIAQDLYFNKSSFSDTIELARPDIWPPANPVIQFAYPTPQGVAIGWQYSLDEDVAKHKLQRRLKKDYQWMDLCIISKENEAIFGQNKVVLSDYKANFIDSFKLENTEYYYRIIALDQAGNMATSKKIEVVPFSAYDDVISDFHVDIIRDRIPPSTRVIDELEKLNSPHIAEQISALTKTDIKMALAWKCSLTKKLTGFVIFRAIAGEAGFTAIKEISIAQALGKSSNVVIDALIEKEDENYGFVDENLMTGRQYSYYVVGKYKNGKETRRSAVITKKVEK